MPSGRLQQQFIRLWQCCEGQSQETTLNELADLLSCSRRHMRTLLNTMQQQGWLSWEAEAGRGKRSRLTRSVSDKEVYALARSLEVEISALFSVK